MPTFERLTRAALKALPAGGRLAEHGIYYEKLSNGDGRFGIHLRIDGKSINRVIGKESEGATRGDAEAVIERLKTESREGRLKLPKGRKLEMSFKEAVDNYLARLKSTGGKDLIAKKASLTLHLVPFLGSTALSGLNSFELDRYTHARHKKGAAAGTINRELATLSNLLNKAVEWGWLDKIPCPVKKVPDNARKEVYLTLDECNRLLEAARTIHHELYLYIKLGVSSGMRMSEMFSIQLSNIDIQANDIYLPKAKAGARHQHISPEVAAYLEFYLKEYCAHDQVWLFPSEKSTGGHRTNITKSFNRAVKQAKITKKINRHTLRHTAISLLIQSGVDFVTVMEISGHKTLRMVQRYAHHDNLRVKTAMSKIDSAIKDSCHRRLPKEA